MIKSTSIFGKNKWRIKDKTIDRSNKNLICVGNLPIRFEEADFDFKKALKRSKKEIQNLNELKVIRHLNSKFKFLKKFDMSLNTFPLLDIDLVLRGLLNLKGLNQRRLIEKRIGGFQCMILKCWKRKHKLCERETWRSDSFKV